MSSLSEIDVDSCADDVLLGVDAVAQIIAEAGEKKSFNEIMNGLTDLPNSKPPNLILDRQSS